MPLTPPPRDQADGLRRLFAGIELRALPLVSNPFVESAGVGVERLSAALALQGRRTLIVDAAETAPAPPEASALGLDDCIESLTPQISYLPARGLPRRWVDTRGSAARLLDALAPAAPGTDALLLHANASDLARLFGRRAARPVLLAADEPESLKHAYAALKLLVQRCGWLSFDLLLLARPRASRGLAIANSLARCADHFLGAALADWACVDPRGAARALPEAAVRRIVAAQLQLDEAPHSRADAGCLPGGATPPHTLTARH